MAAMPIKSLELHYTMIQFLVIINVFLAASRIGKYPPLSASTWVNIISLVNCLAKLHVAELWQCELPINTLSNGKY